MPAWSKIADLCPAGSEQSIVQLEADLQISLPADYREFLASHDGQTEDGEWVELSRLLAVAEIVPFWKELRDLQLNFVPKDSGVKGGFRDGWIPIANIGRHFLALDLDPDEGGQRGQIIGFYADDDDVRWIARSFSDACLTVFSEGDD
jgi:cell wall assembly regulator SMI1